MVQIEGDPDSPPAAGACARRVPPRSSSPRDPRASSTSSTGARARPTGRRSDLEHGDGHGRRPGDRHPRPTHGSGSSTGADEPAARMGIADLGGATLDNEENYLIKKLLTAPRRRAGREPGARLPQLHGVRLGTSFGRGGATTFPQDLQNADCIVIEGSNMAEAHPVAFQWVMEAKARGARVIHVDPRFSRTSAVADSTCRSAPAATSPSSAASSTTSSRTAIGTSTSTCRYTNASTIIDEALPRHRGPRRPVLGLIRPAASTTTSASTPTGHGRHRGRARAQAPAGQQQRRRPAASGASRRRASPTAQAGRTSRPSSPTAMRPCSTRAASFSSSNGTSRATRPRWSSRPAGSRRRCSSRSASTVTENSGPDRTDGLRLRRRLDPAHGRRSVHPRRRDPPAAARQHRPPRRRHHGAARSRQHPGLDRHPDAVQPAARLPPHAARRTGTRLSTTSSSDRSADKGCWANMESYMVSLLKAWWATPPRRRTTSASTTCRG